MKPIFSVLVLILLHANAQAQKCPPGDRTFGLNGIATGVKGPSSRTLVQPDLKIIQAGSVLVGNTFQFYVQRFDAAGQPDPGFGNQGQVFIKTDAEYAYLYDALLQPDGKIVLCGQASDNNGDYSLMLARVNADGSPDNGFGVNGIIRYASYNTFGEFKLRLSQPGQKLLLAGTVSDIANLCNYDRYNYPKAVIARFHTDGTPDTLFGEKGRIMIASGNYDDYGRDIIPLANGQFLLAAEAGDDCSCLADYYFGEYWQCNVRKLVVQRYNASGKLDSSFGTQGSIIDSSDFSRGSTWLAGDGEHFFIAGSRSTNELVVRKYNRQGLSDRTYGAGGTVVIDLSADIGITGIWLSAVLYEQNGKLILGSTLGNGELLLVRLNASGRPDTSFFKDGYVTLRFDQSNPQNNIFNQLTSLAWQGDSLLVGGYHQRIAETRSMLTRISAFSDQLKPAILASGSLAFCFGDSVRLTSSISGTYQWYRYDIPVPGATNQSIVVRNNSEMKVLVANSDGCGVSDPAMVTIYPLPLPPSISWDGKRMSVDSGYVRYVWFLNDQAIDSSSGFRLDPGSKLGTYTVKLWNAFNCTVLSIPFNYVVTSIADIRLGDATCRLFPNPARDRFFIDYQPVTIKRTTADIIDMSGRIVSSVVLRQGYNEISLANFRGGMYAVVLSSGSERVIRKIILVK